MGFIEQFSRLHRGYCQYIERNGSVDNITDSVSDFIGWIRFMDDFVKKEGTDVIEEFLNL